MRQFAGLNSSQNEIYERAEKKTKEFEDYLLGEIAAMHGEDRNTAVHACSHSASWVRGYDEMMDAMNEIYGMIEKAK